MSAQRAREERRSGGSEENLSQMEMDEYATTEAEKKSLVDRQVRLSSSYFWHASLNNSHGSAKNVACCYCIFSVICLWLVQVFFLLLCF